jgi:ubiquinone/menaquinone biosynthesis C-methylase UbiE
VFEGVAGRATAKVMARMNRESEREAIDLLVPSSGDRVVALGIGPGVGVDLLAAKLEHGRVVGVDPSAAMLAEARRRNRRWIDLGVVELVEGTAACLGSPDGAFDGAIAVNSIQLWEPLDASLSEVARVLRTGARLVTLTHNWAIERSTGKSVDWWCGWVAELSELVGFRAPQVGRAQAEGGKAVVFEATRA